MNKLARWWCAYLATLLAATTADLLLMGKESDRDLTAWRMFCGPGGSNHLHIFLGVRAEDSKEGWSVALLFTTTAETEQGVFAYSSAKAQKKKIIINQTNKKQIISMQIDRGIEFYWVLKRNAYRSVTLHRFWHLHIRKLLSPSPLWSQNSGGWNASIELGRRNAALGCSWMQLGSSVLPATLHSCQPKKIAGAHRNGPSAALSCCSGNTIQSMSLPCSCDLGMSRGTSPSLP